MKTSRLYKNICTSNTTKFFTNILVQARGFHIDFIADADGILKRKVRLGESDDSDDEDSVEAVATSYDATFTTDQFTRINKIAGLGSTMQIFSGSKDLPLLFRSSVGSLGKISVYIKSKELLDKELGGSDSDNSDTDM